jgi:hypothetical protein
MNKHKSSTITNSACVTLRASSTCINIHNENLTFRVSTTTFNTYTPIELVSSTKNAGQYPSEGTLTKRGRVCTATRSTNSIAAVNVPLTLSAEWAEVALCNCKIINTTGRISHWTSRTRGWIATGVSWCNWREWSRIWRQNKYCKEWIHCNQNIDLIDVCMYTGSGSDIVFIPSEIILHGGPFSRCILAILLPYLWAFIAKELLTAVARQLRYICRYLGRNKLCGIFRSGIEDSVFNLLPQLACWRNWSRYHGLHSLMGS